MTVCREVPLPFDLAPLIREIPELREVSREKIAMRTANDGLLVVAEVDDRLAGFKLGYSLNETTFYSWLGGVAPAFRGRGIARELLQLQESLASARGYSLIRVKSMECFPAMLRLLESERYKLVAREEQDGADEKLVFEKPL